MRKSDKIEEKILDAALWGAVIWGGIAIVSHMERQARGAKGVGAAKRRIFKELSMAQKAGVDFTKKFDELDEKEIKALEKVSSDTGYTETYYKSLKKAYDAVSGIGTTYDVVDADGNTVLTWTDNPGEQAASQQRVLEAEERAAAARKRLKDARRAGEQMALFGCGYANTPTYSKQQIDIYINTHHDLSFMFTRDENGKILVEAGDETGGRAFYVGEKNFKYLYSYILRNLLPFAIWQGDHWIIRNDKNGVFDIGYAPEVEDELYEIWREQLEYGNTERDYETWREIYGDEFAKTDVLPYM